MTKSKIFSIFSLSFILGAFGASFYYPREFDYFYVFVGLIFALILLIVFYRQPKVVVFGLLIGLFLGAVILVNYRLDEIKKLEDNGYFSREVIVIKEPEIKEKYQKLVVKAEETDYRLMISAGLYPEYNYGDRLKINCHLEKPNNLSESSDFDYRMHLAKEKIYYLCENEEIKKISENSGNRIYAIILAVKNKFSENIARLIPYPESALMEGLLLGGDDNLPTELKNSFSKTGMTHIVAVSGYNVTIIAEYLMLIGIFLGLWRRQAFWLAISGIILFVILVGSPSSAVRAGVMGILLLWAMQKGRLANAQNAILFAASVMIIANPLILRWDVGFQLSFFATIGIVYLYPLFEKMLERFMEKRRSYISSLFRLIFETLFLSIAAQIFVLPIILYNFKNLSVISPLANILVLPLIPFIMLLGFLASALSFLNLFLAKIFAWIVFLPLFYETFVIDLLSKLKYSSIEIASFPLSGVVLWYVVLLSIIFYSKKNRGE